MENKTVTAELTIVDPKEFGLEAKNATSIESAFKPKMIERDSFSEQYETIIKQELNSETFEQARQLRLKLVKVRTGIAEVHKTEKAFYLASGKYVDALKNKLTLPIEQMEEKLMEIEKYEARIEAERVAKLKQERIEKLLPFGTDVTFIQLDQMSDEQFEQLLSREEMAYNAKIEAEKKAEQEKIEAEKKAEAERLEKEKAEKLERERIEKENAELKKQQEQREEAEKQRIAKELAKVEKFAKMLVADGFELSNNDSYIPKDQHRWCKDEYSVSFGQLTLIESGDELKELIDTTNNRISERKRLEKEQADKDAEIAKYKQELDAEKQRKEKELADEKARIEAEESEKLAKEKALKNADDQTKVKNFYDLFKSVEFPELNSDAGKAMSKDINARMAELKKQIILQSKGLL